MYLWDNQKEKIMNENVEKNPMDLNGDGKVTFSEKVQYTVGKAQEKTEEVLNEIKDDAVEALGEAKVLAGKAKEKAAEAKVKVGEKAAEAKEKAAEAKVKVGEKVAEAKEKAEGKIQELKEKKA